MTLSLKDKFLSQFTNEVRTSCTNCYVYFLYIASTLKDVKLVSCEIEWFKFYDSTV